MKLAFTTLGCPDWTLREIAGKAKEYGYEGVELRVADDGIHLSPEASPEELRQARQAFDDAGVPVISLAGYASFASPEQDAIEKNRKLASRLCDIAGALGARWVRIYAGRLEEPDTTDDASPRIAAALKPAADEAAQRGVTLAVETHDSWCAGRDVLKILRRLDSPGVGVVFDVHNTFSATGEWRETYRQIQPYVCYWHLKDGYRTPDGRGHNVMLGAGDLPVRDILAQLKEDRFDAYLSFEWEKRWQADLEAPERVFPQYACKVRAIWQEL